MPKHSLLQIQYIFNLDSVKGRLANTTTIPLVYLNSNSTYGKGEIVIITSIKSALVDFQFLVDCDFTLVTNSRVIFIFYTD